MARPRKPTAVKVLAGTQRRDRLQPNEPTPPVGEPDKSLAHLSPTAQKLWPMFSAILLELGVLTTADGPALASLVEAYADGVDARDLIEADGGPIYQTTNRDGSVMFRAHPAVALKTDADRRFALWANQFGLTPAARSKVSAQVADKKDNSWNEI